MTPENRRRLKRALALLCAVLCLTTARADDEHIDVRVEITDGLVTIDSSFLVKATPQEAWAVMTDYDRAVEFVSDLQTSRILKREDNVLYVYQKGVTGFGPFSFPVELERKILLTPFEKMESHMIRGTLKKQQGTTRLVPEGAGTRVTNRTETVPDTWIPLVFGRLLVEREARGKFRELRDEIMRRKNAATTK